MIWNPDRNIFVIPYVDHPVTWYGFLFATGFFVGFFLIRKMFAAFVQDPSKSEAAVQLEAVSLTDRLAVLVVIGGVLGARLGHVFFYDWPHYSTHPIDIFKIWEGGLASHGGAIGIFIALIFFVVLSRKSTPKLTYLTALDAIVVPTAFAAGCIRIGNFINQEITGLPTNVAWGVTFLHPVDGPAGIPLHPVQLYEAAFYLIVFGILWSLWMRHKEALGTGLFSGLFFVLVFGFRFFIEYFKAPQNVTFDTQGWFTMGQLLSLPLVALGLLLLMRAYVKR